MSSAANAGIARNPASGAATSIASNIVNACTIPATGVLPPALIFIAVRAMAPVAGRPANKDEPIFAAPWASTSALGRCLPPFMRSATIADNSDSTPAKNAITNAEGNNSIIRTSVIEGSEGIGGSFGNAPKRESMVSTGKFMTATMADVAATATINPGAFGASLRKATITASVTMPIANALRFRPSRAFQITAIFSRNSAGGLAIARPKRSAI